jgi:hypothetical protein
MTIQDPPGDVVAHIPPPPLRRGLVSVRDLRRVQRRRALPTRVTQLVQRRVRRQMVGSPGRGPSGVPAPLRLLSGVAPLLRLFSRFMAIGVLEGHVALSPTDTVAQAGPVPVPRQAQPGVAELGVASWPRTKDPR